MPTSPEPAGSEPAASPAPAGMPGSVRVGAIAMGVLAALLLTYAGLLWYSFDVTVAQIANAAILLTYAGLLWYSFDVTVAQIANAANGVSEDAARRFVLTLLIPSLLIGVVLALAAWFLPRRHAWARWIGAAASGLLALLMLFSMVAGGGISILPLVLFALAALALRSLLARSTGTWVPPLRSRG